MNKLRFQKQVKNCEKKLDEKTKILKKYEKIIKSLKLKKKV